MPEASDQNQLRERNINNIGCAEHHRVPVQVCVPRCVSCPFQCATTNINSKMFALPKLRVRIPQRERALSKRTCAQRVPCNHLHHSSSPETCAWRNHGCTQPTVHHRPTDVRWCIHTASSYNQYPSTVGPPLEPHRATTVCDDSCGCASAFSVDAADACQRGR